MSASSRGASFLKTAALPFAFLLCVVAIVAHHEMWRDELEYWVLARDAASLGELRHATLYIGQPPLGHLVLYGLSRATRDPRAMQLANLLFAAGAVAIFAAAAPFSRRVKWLFAFGYFPLYEYGVIARYYALSLLLGLAFGALWSRAGRLRPAAGLLGALFALTTFHATIVAIAIALAVLADWAARRHRPAASETVALGLLVLGIGASVALAKPPSDARFLKPWNLSMSAADAAKMPIQVATAYLPLPGFEPPYWNSSLFAASPALQVALGLALFGAFAWALRRSVPALVLLAASSAGILAFHQLQYGGYLRHTSYLFVALILAFWKATADPRPDPPPAWSLRLLTAVLVVQVVAALCLAVLDIRYPFSASEATASFLRERNLARLPLVAFPDYRGVPVAAILDRSFYSPEARRFIRQVEWGPEQPKIDRAGLYAAVADVHRQTGRRQVVLLVNDPLTDVLRPPRLQEQACLEPVLTSEQYCVYLSQLPGAAH